VAKNYNAKRAHHGILAEIDSREIPAVLYAHYLASDALVLTNVLPSFGNGNAAACNGGRGEEQCQQQWQKSVEGRPAETDTNLGWGNKHRNLGKYRVQNHCMAGTAIDEGTRWNKN
jgi:hypothetical protein